MTIEHTQNTQIFLAFHPLYEEDKLDVWHLCFIWDG